jgi:hypothetical protein
VSLGERPRTPRDSASRVFKPGVHYGGELALVLRGTSIGLVGQREGPVARERSQGDSRVLKTATGAGSDAERLEPGASEE